MFKKQVVFYKSDVLPDVKVGQSAFVIPLNHTSIWVSSNQIAQTSEVVAIREGGVFETLNSIYKPEEMQ